MFCLDAACECSAVALYTHTHLRPCTTKAFCSRCVLAAGNVTCFSNRLRVNCLENLHRRYHPACIFTNLVGALILSKSCRPPTSNLLLHLAMRAHA